MANRPIFIGLLCCAALTIGWFVNRPQTLTDFQQIDNHTLELEFRYPVTQAERYDFPNVPLVEEDLATPKTEPLKAGSRRIRIPLHQETEEQEYSVLLRLKDWRCTLPLPHAWMACRNFIELIRQSPLLLKNKFDYDHAEGYTILGRRSIKVGTDTPSNKGPLRFVGKSDISLPASPGVPEIAPYPELRQAAALVAYISNHKIRGGPINSRYEDFLAQPLSTKWELLEKGRVAVMCQGLRDLFLHASAGVEGVKLRAVELYNYAPAFPKLITYGHSSSEVWVSALNKWVLIDAWLGIIVVDTQGTPLSANEIAQSKAHPENLRIVPLQEKLTRFHVDKYGRQQLYATSPSQLRLTDFSSDGSFSTPGFIFYFNTILARNFTITR